MPAYRLASEASADISGTLYDWAVFMEHMQAMGANVSLMSVDGRRINAGRVEITVSVTLTAEQQAHLHVVPA